MSADLTTLLTDALVSEWASLTDDEGEADFLRTDTDTRAIAEEIVSPLAAAVRASEWARELRAKELETAAILPEARLSGHSGVSVRWLRARAQAIREEAGDGE